nr:hypothetical protein CFP56_42372 [Quercus suber]
MANGEGCIGSKEKSHRWEQEKEDSINLEENVDGFNEFSMTNVESYFLMDSYSYSSSIRQGNKISKEGLTMMERGRPHCYFEEEEFSELVKVGIDMDLDLTKPKKLLQVELVCLVFDC